MEKASPEVIKHNLAVAKRERKEREALRSFKARTAEAKKPLKHNPFASIFGK